MFQADGFLVGRAAGDPGTAKIDARERGAAPGTAVILLEGFAAGVASIAHEGRRLQLTTTFGNCPKGWQANSRSEMTNE